MEGDQRPIDRAEYNRLRRMAKSFHPVGIDGDVMIGDKLRSLLLLFGTINIGLDSNGAATVAVVVDADRKKVDVPDGVISLGDARVIARRYETARENIQELDDLKVRVLQRTPAMTTANFGDAGVRSSAVRWAEAAVETILEPGRMENMVVNLDRVENLVSQRRAGFSALDIRYRNAIALKSAEFRALLHPQPANQVRGQAGPPIRPPVVPGEGQAPPGGGGPEVGVGGGVPPPSRPPRGGGRNRGARGRGRRGGPAGGSQQDA